MPYSDQQLARLKLKPMADIPNRDGFKLFAITHNLTRVHETVIVSERGAYKLTRGQVSDYIGWTV